MSTLAVQTMSRHMTLPFSPGASILPIALSTGGDAQQVLIAVYDFSDYQSRFNQVPHPSYVLVAQKDLGVSVQVSIDYVSRSAGGQQGSISLTVPAGTLAGASFGDWRLADGTSARSLLANPDIRLSALHMSPPAPDGGAANWWGLIALLGNMARLMWAIGGERDSIRRHMELVQTQRYVAQAVRYSLDLLGHDLGVPRFPPRPYSFDDDTLALYHLDDQFADNQGTVQDSVTDYAPPGNPGQRADVASVIGRFGSGVAFRAPTASITISASTHTFDLDAGQSFTLECFVMPDFNTPDGEILSKLPAASGTSSPATPAGWSLSIGTFGRGISLNVRLLLSDGTQQVPLFADQRLPTDSYSHLAGVLDRQTNMAYLYVNGMVVKAQSIAGLGALTNVEPLCIGSGASGSTYRGVIDEVRFSRVARKAFNPALGEADEDYRRRLTLFASWTLPTRPNLMMMLNTSVGNIKGITGPDPIVLDDTDAPTIVGTLPITVNPAVPSLVPAVTSTDATVTLLVQQGGRTQPADGFLLQTGDTIKLNIQPLPTQQQSVSWFAIIYGPGQASLVPPTNGPTVSLVASAPGQVQVKAELIDSQNVIAGISTLRILPRLTDMSVGASIGADGTLNIAPDVAGAPDTFFHPTYLVTHNDPRVTYGSDLNHRRMQPALAALLDKLLAILTSNGMVGQVGATRNYFNQFKFGERHFVDERLEIVQAYTPGADDSSVMNRLFRVGRALILHHPAITGDALAVMAHSVGFTYVSRLQGEQVLVLQRPGELVTISGPSAVTEDASIPLSVSPQAVPMGIAASSSTVYTANNGTDSVSMIDSTTGQVRGALKVGRGPCALALSPDGKRLYTADSRGDSITVMSVDSTGNLQIVQILPVQRNPVALAHHPDASAQRLYVVCQDDNALLEIDTNALQVVNTLAVGTGPTGVALTPDGKEAWVTLNGDSQVAIVSTSPLQKATSVAVTPAPLTIAIAPDGKRAYATQPTSNSVVVLDVVGRTILATSQLESSSGGIAVALDGASVYVSSKERERISVLQPDGTAKGTIKTGQGTDNLTVLSTTRLYTVTRGASIVNVIDLQQNMVVTARQLGTGLGEYLTWLLVQGQSTQAALDSDTTPAVLLSGIHAGPALVRAIYVPPGSTPPYTFTVRLKDESNAPIVRKEQYDLIMNILNVFHPIGVEVLTEAIRRHVIEVRGQLTNLIPDYTYPNFRARAPLPK